MFCGYMSQPDKFDMEATTFGLPLFAYLEIRFFKTKAEKVADIDRVKVAVRKLILLEF